ncbi:MAG: 50S ribosomal protein L23 [Alphaproteobacteria bacterium]|nr:50S ribosomal protein L23 [Alphaproteobacteria bacterium]
MTEAAVKKAKAPKAKAAKPAAPTIAHYGVIVSPVITEKATNITASRQYTFRVARAATKPVIKSAVESLFNVKVEAVNTHNRQGKTKRFKGKIGFRSDVKFAIVTLAEGNSIDMQSGV